MATNPNILSRVAIRIIRMYQAAISPMIGGRCACRFTPSCSEYTRTAIEKYGILRGGIMGVRRILRCRPGGGYGWDPVP